MIAFDRGSFKDPSGRVFYQNGRVFRTMSADAQRAFESAHAAGLIGSLVNDQLLIESELVPAPDELAGRAGKFVLEQRRIPLVTYAYEWSFEMLRDAALVTLRILERSLSDGFILKDATSFNILFDGTAPKLVDVPSLEPYREGQIWDGYSQFCRCFLFPLFVSAYRDLDVQPLLRGTLGEVPVADASRLLRPRDALKPGVLRDVFLQARLERGFAMSAGTVKSAAGARGYPKAALVSSVRRLLKIVGHLPGPSTESTWSRYQSECGYSDHDRESKLEAVEAMLAAGRPSRVIDLGCNTGEYSEAARAGGAEVVALDMDSRAIDRLYRRNAQLASLSPLVANLLNPTPALGWELAERKSLLERIRTDAFLALALIHHLRIAGGIPLSSIVALLFEIAPEGLVEWVDKDDAMVRSMLALRPDVYPDYTWASFESMVRDHGEIVTVRSTHEGRRRLCHVRARPGPHGRGAERKEPA